MTIHTNGTRIRIADMWPTFAEFREALFPLVRGTLIGSITGLMPAVGPSITSFIAYAVEKRVSRHPERFGTGKIAGLVAPEASTHSNVQTAFIPKLTLGIPGEAVMALLLSALIL